MRTVEALKNLYTALGGTLSDIETITNISDVVNAISAIAGSSSGGLTVKKATLKTVVPVANAGRINIALSDLPDDFAGGLNLLSVHSYTESGGFINIGNFYMPFLFCVNNSQPSYYSAYLYKVSGQIPSFSSSDFPAADTKIIIEYEYLAKEE